MSECIISASADNYAIFITDYVSPKKAAKIVEDTDLRRCSYHNYYTGEEWGNAEYYDICIDVSKVGEDGALRLIEAYINETGVL